MKTNRQIVDECNELAREFFSRHGFQVREGFKFWQARNRRELLMWELAVLAYEHIEGTPVDDALTDLEDEELPVFAGEGI